MRMSMILGGAATSSNGRGNTKAAEIMFYGGLRFSFLVALFIVFGYWDLSLHEYCVGMIRARRRGDVPGLCIIYCLDIVGGFTLDN